MAFEVFILHSASIEVTEILECYNTQAGISAHGFYDAYLAAVEKLKANPQFYGYVHKEFRRLLIEKFPYKVIYQINGNKVTIYGVSHASRDDREWFKKA